MVFSPEWERRYVENTHASVWPWSDLVSCAMRHSAAKLAAGANTRVLEIGCGAGANVPFFQKFGVSYCGIDGSEAVIARLRSRFTAWQDRFFVADFTTTMPVQGPFDIIVDRSSMTHNTEQDIRRGLGLIHQEMMPGGVYYGIGWFSVQCSEFTRGHPAEDDWTRMGYHDGPFFDTGKVHFSDKMHLLDLFQDFEILSLQHSLVMTEIPVSEEKLAYWNIVARKRSS
ncbi:MAG: class I SAM-dependent methyltransferase [Magnetococcales bacterium]|nr:class I SAM-dependent methyltransferase [Magnetococcales bacterium]